MERLNGATAEALERGRERYNAAFAALRKAGTPVDEAAFLKHMGENIAPIVDGVAAGFPERAGGVLDALFTVSLELFKSSLLGPNARTPAVADVWAQLLRPMTGLIQRDPRRVTASMSNAVGNVASTPGARPNEWIAQMRRASTLCTSVQELLECGKIAAWRSGMPHYRPGALAAARALPPTLAAGVLELPAGASSAVVSDALDRLDADPWAAATDAPGAPTLKLAARVGAFRAFGGDFIRPPKVWSAAKALYVSDGDATWQLVGDRYGCLFMRVDQAPPADAIPPDTHVLSNGMVTWGKDRVNENALSLASAWACDGKTLAATSANSHHVFLFAKTSANPRGGADAA